MTVDKCYCSCIEGKNYLCTHCASQLQKDKAEFRKALLALFNAIVEFEKYVEGPIDTPFLIAVTAHSPTITKAQEQEKALRKLGELP